MQRNLNLQPILQENSALSHTQDFKRPSSDENTREWISAFNTSILTTSSPQISSQMRSKSSADLNEIMQSPEFASLIIAAQHLADSQGLSKEEATERLINTFREVDSIWKQIVMSRGLKAIIG